MTKEFHDNPDYLESVRLLKDLHFLMLNGKGDEEAADRIREAMDAPWHRLSPAEMARIRGLSADLYTLGEALSVATTASPIPFQAAEDLQAAWNAGEWDQVLVRLRGCSFLPADKLAYYRGICWMELGDFDTAMLFFQEAYRLNPSNGQHAVAFINALVRLERFEQAAGLAKHVVEQPNVSDPLLLYVAGHALLMAARKSTSQIAQPHYETTIQVLRKALHAFQSVEQDPALVPYKINCCLEIGLCHLLLGQPELALATYDEGLQRHPGDPRLQTMRRHLLHDSLDVERLLYQKASPVRDLESLVSVP